MYSVCMQWNIAVLYLHPAPSNAGSGKGGEERGVSKNRV